MVPLLTAFDTWRVVVQGLNDLLKQQLPQGRAVSAQKKPTCPRQRTPSDTPAYSSTSPPALPGCPSS